MKPAVRIALASTAATALVLLGVGALVYLRTRAALGEEPDPGESRQAESDEALAELLAQLLVGWPIAVALAAVIAYLAARAALRPVVESVERERRFVADAGHELRTPLTLLSGELELARRGDRSREELEAALRIASDEVDRLVRLAEDLLALASSKDGDLPLKRERVDAGALLEAVARRFGGVSVEAQPGLVVNGDRLRLEQALGNLVDNARRHGAGDVTIVARAAGREVELAVRDGGDGFPANFLPHAFERFSRADAARGRGGAGLGLAIVDAVVRAHGGRARARNLAGGGAEVTLTLPRQP